MERTFLGEFLKARERLFEGFLTTIEISALVIAIGLVTGVIGGLLLVYGPRPVRLLMRVYVDVLRGIPILVLILFSYYGLALIGLNISAFTAGVVALAGFCSAHMSEIFRGAIGSIPVGQAEAAKAIGLTFAQRFVYVLLPQAARPIGPPASSGKRKKLNTTTNASVTTARSTLLPMMRAVDPVPRRGRMGSGSPTATSWRRLTPCRRPATSNASARAR